MTQMDAAAAASEKSSVPDRNNEQDSPFLFQDSMTTGNVEEPRREDYNNNDDGYGILGRCKFNGAPSVRKIVHNLYTLIDFMMYLILVFRLYLSDLINLHRSPLFLSGFRVFDRVLAFQFRQYR